jgi:RNA polymerase subunit RPABC4/transcription elongation factor Spt4
MPYIHDHCGGFVSALTCKCDKCGKKWNWFKFWFDFRGMRKHVIIVSPNKADIARKLAKRHEKAAYAGWADRLPGVGAVASALPNWPRWARILTLVTVVAVVVLLIVFLS